MEFDFNGMLFALSFALDCVEHDIIGVATNHGKRVAALAIHVSEGLGVLESGEERQMLSACAVMHDCALTEYIHDEFGGVYESMETRPIPDVGAHCTMGEEAMRLMPFDWDMAEGAVLYHHENADGSGPFGKRAEEIPQSARLIQIADTVDARFDLSRVDGEKLEALRAFLKSGAGTLFARAEAEALLAFLEGNALEGLRDERIDERLEELLPGGSMPCTPEQLMDFARVFARVVDYKSPFTCRHSVGVAEKARTMAILYGADEELAARIYFAGALHDIGKLVVERDVLEKPDKLDDAEYRHIQTHAYYTERILSAVPGIEEMTRWAANHHEKLDGTGYPFGLRAVELGKWERMMAVVDIYQALTEERPYKKGMEHSTAMALLQKMAAAGKVDGEIVRDAAARFAQR